MNYRRSLPRTIVAIGAALLLSAPVAGQQRDAAGKKPSLSFRATPPTGFTPLRVQVGVELKGGDDDYAEFYCPTLEWDWDDGTISENSSDCNPYEAGKSAIQRRFSSSHTFRQSGEYRVTFRIKQKDKVMASVSGTVSVRAGAREGYYE